MEITGKLDVDFRNLCVDRINNPNVDVGSYQRVHDTLNIYYHGFMDDFDDIAYVTQPTQIEPGIYEVETYGIKAYLFLWVSTPGVLPQMRGLLVKTDDKNLIAHALVAYEEQREFI